MFDTVACASSRRLDANDWGVRTTRLRRPRRHRSSHAPPASTASRPALVTCATPLLWDGTAQISELIWVERKRKYFCKRGLTRFRKIRSDLPVGSICRIPMPGFDLSWRQISKQQDANEAEATKQSRSRHSGMVRQHRPQMRNCASGNLEIPGSMLSHRPGMTASTLLLPASARRSRTCAEIRPPAPSARRGALRCR